MTGISITRNAIRCKKCGDEIESNSAHELKWCSCGVVAVGGGGWYLKRCFESPDDFEELSEYEVEAVHFEDPYRSPHPPKRSEVRNFRRQMSRL